MCVSHNVPNYQYIASIDICKIRDDSGCFQDIHAYTARAGREKKKDNARREDERLESPVAQDNNGPLVR